MYRVTIRTTARAGPRTSSRLHSVIRAIDRWRRTRRTMMALQVLDDAMLTDIGVSRCAIDWVARSSSPDPEAR